MGLPMPVSIIPTLSACFRMFFRISGVQLTPFLYASGFSVMVIAFSGQNVAHLWQATHCLWFGVTLSLNSIAEKLQLKTQRLHFLHLSWSTFTTNSAGSCDSIIPLPHLGCLQQPCPLSGSILHPGLELSLLSRILRMPYR